MLGTIDATRARPGPGARPMALLILAVGVAIGAALAENPSGAGTPVAVARSPGASGDAVADVRRPVRVIPLFVDDAAAGH